MPPYGGGMETNMIKSTLFRFAEITGLCIFLSAVISAIFSIPQFVTDVAACRVVLVLANIIFLAAGIYLLRRCFFFMRHTLSFFIVNYSAYALFVIANIATLALAPAATYTWLFGITKILSIASAFNVSNLRSAIVFHAIMVVIIALSPMGMDRIILDDEIRIAEEEDEDTETL